MDAGFTIKGKILVDKYKYILLIIYSVFLFILGRLTVSRPSQIVSMSSTNSITTQKSKVISQIDNQKYRNTNEQSNYIEKSFNKKGVLVHEIIHTTSQGSISEVATQDNSKFTVNSTQDLKTQTKTITDYQPNLLFGSSIPVLDITKPQGFQFTNFQVMVEYRVINNIYLFGSTNYNFSNCSIGVLFPI